MTVFPYKILDLTHTLDENIPSWSGGCGYSHKTTLDYAESPEKVKFKVQKLTMHAGIGTHLDAPSHCVPGGISVDEIPLDSLIVPCVMMDVSSLAHERYSLSAQTILDFEQAHGPIPPHSLVLVYTGWEKYWKTPALYKNSHIFPSVSVQAATFLLDRNVAGLGIDTLSPDRPEDGFLVHKHFLGANKYLIENAAHLSFLPPTGSFVAALPLKTKGGTEAPVRLIGLVQKGS